MGDRGRDARQSNTPGACADRLHARLALIQDGLHNIFSDACDSVDDTREYVRNRRWAADAWAQVCSSMPDGFSKEYAQGFKDGFAEYLYGGKPEPPPVAPKRFRTLSYQTPAGYHAIQEWFAGYRHGVSVAIEGGYRRWVTAPVAVPPPPPLPPPMPALPPPMPLPAPPMEVLPAPRLIDPAAKPKPQAAPPPAIVPSRETVVPSQEIVPPPQAVRPPEQAVAPPDEPPLESRKTSQLYMPPAQDVALAPEEARPVQQASAPPEPAPPHAIMLPPGPAHDDAHWTVAWDLPVARFGIPRALGLPPRPGLFGILLPPQVLPTEDDTGFEEQESPILGLPLPRSEQ